MSESIRPEQTAERENLLLGLATRVRRLREARSWTQAELAERSGLSVRFLARVEAGEGNISILRLEALAQALGTRSDELLRPGRSRPQPLIALVGLRGAGKSSVGPELAGLLDLPFIEMDTLITETCGLPLDQVFELHGEGYYRKLEREILRGILTRGEPAVLAAAGGVVNEPASWAMLCEQATVIWLKASPEDHWNRVVAQGDKRPMADNPAAMDELRAMLTEREEIYGQAGLIVETSERSPQEIARTILIELSRESG